MGILKNHTALYTDFYELTMDQGYFLAGRHRKTACFDYFFRKLPFKGGYVVFAGLQDLLELIHDFVFEKDDLDYLRSLGFRNEFLTYLSTFRFNGSLYSVREGEIIFPYEPILRAEGNILEAQLIETVVLNTLNFESLIATKASRMKMAAGSRSIIDFGLRRAQGLGGVHASRAAIIGGADSTSNVYSACVFGLKPSGTMAHSWVESFDEEQEAFRTFSKIFPDTSIFLVDSYETLKSGVPKAIQVALAMKNEGNHLLGIRLDSGDLAYLSKHARVLLDEAGLKDVKIIASNQLDEYIIKSLLDQGAPIDVFGVGTSLVTGRSDGALDGVYKLSMFDDEPRLKISEDIEKIILPGIKQVYRFINENQSFFGDAILCGSENEIVTMFHPHQSAKHTELAGKRHEELLTCVMQEGKTILPRQTPYQIAEYSRNRLSLLPEEHRRFENPHIYKVGVSAQLIELRDKLVNQHSHLSLV